MKVRTWKCEVEHCPIQQVIMGVEESVTLDNMLSAIRCLYCLNPMTPVLPPPPPPEQPGKN